MTHRLSNFILVLAIIVLGTLGLLFVVLDFQTVDAGLFVPRHYTWRTVSRAFEPRRISASDVQYIKSWMTFDYLNRIFGLPKLYLQTSLDVRSTRYPQMTLHDAAKQSGRKDESFVQEVQQRVGQYLSDHQPVPQTTQTQ